MTWSESALKVKEAAEYYRNKAKETKAMTCRFELEWKGEPYPRSCPTCGLGGTCHKGYLQVKKSEGGYCLVNPEGKTIKPVLEVNTMTMEERQKETTRLAEEQRSKVDNEPIPEGVYFSVDNFYDVLTRRGMGTDFWYRWKYRKAEFPSDPKELKRDQEAVFDPRTPRQELLDAKPYFTDMQRYKLIDYIVATFDVGHTPYQTLNKRVDEIARIVLER